VLSKQIASEPTSSPEASSDSPPPRAQQSSGSQPEHDFGWPTGVIFMDTRDYTRAFATSALTALGVDPGPARTSIRRKRQSNVSSEKTAGSK